MQIFKTVLITGVAALGLFSVSAIAADTQGDARLREALRKKMSEMDNPTTLAKPAAASTATAAPIKPQDDAQTEQLRQALHERMEKDAAAEKVVPAAAASAKPSPATPVQMAAPALPINATKEQKLDSLLQQYKADAITPQQYHEQRAKILAE